MSSILNILDNLADALEAKGCLKEASEIDVISNTLESRIACTLDAIADTLESHGYLKAASEIDVISNTLEQPEMGRDPASLLQTLKSFGSKQQVAEFLRSIMDKAPDKFKKLVDEIWELAKNVPLSGLGRSASDTEMSDKKQWLVNIDKSDMSAYEHALKPHISISEGDPIGTPYYSVHTLKDSMNMIGLYTTDPEDKWPPWVLKERQQQDKRNLDLPMGEERYPENRRSKTPPT